MTFTSSYLESAVIPNSASEVALVGLVSATAGFLLEKKIHQDLATSNPGFTRANQRVEIGLILLSLGFDALTFLVLANVLDTKTLQGIAPVVGAALLPGHITFAIRSLQRNPQ